MAILFPNDLIPVEVMRVSPKGLTLRGPKKLKLPEQIRVGFTHRCERGRLGRVRMLAKVAQTTPAVGGSLIFVRPMALHTMDGRDVLVSFLNRVLRHDRFDTTAFTDAATGIFYHFDQEPSVRAETQGQLAPSQGAGANAGGPNLRFKTDFRVPVRVPVAYVLATDPSTIFKGLAYNATNHSMYVSTHSPLPKNGARLHLIYEVAMHARPTRLHLRGHVYWISAAPGTMEGAFAVHLQLDDPEDLDARAFLRYVDQEQALH